MRISGLDHLRGIGIVLVIVFSLWYLMYYPSEPGFGLLVHIVPGQLHPGDFVFPLFVFCSGASLWLFSGRMGQKSLARAEKRYLWLLLAAIAISGMRLFAPFPDEVTTIALCDLIALEAFWPDSSARLKSLLAALLAFFIAAPVLLPAQFASFASQYLGGWLAIPYYLILLIAGFMVSMAAFPNGKSGRGTLVCLAKWVAAFSALAALGSLLWPLDRTALSLSFLALAAAVSTLLLLALVWLCDGLGFKSRFLAVLGANSLWGWALLYAVSSIFWLSGSKGSFYPIIYLPFCALLLILLYAAMLALGKDKKK